MCSYAWFPDTVLWCMTSVLCLKEQINLFSLREAGYFSFLNLYSIIHSVHSPAMVPE